MIAFDPFTATLDEAQAQPDAYALRGAVMRWGGAKELSYRRPHYERNPLDGVAVCAIHDLVMPDWLARAYMQRWNRVRVKAVGSWDEAFGRPYPKGKQLAAMRKAELDMWSITFAVTEFVQRHPYAPLDPEWERFGAELGVSDTQAERLHARAVKVGFAISPAELRKAQGYPPVPPKFANFGGRQARR